MLESKFERDMLIVQENWNNFVSLIKQDLNDLYLEQRQILVRIKRIEKVKKLLQHSQENIEFLLLHKESIIGLDSSLSQKFGILEAFKKRNNLSNAVATRTFNDILNSESIKKLIDELNFLNKKRDLLDLEIDKIVDLIRSAAFNIDIIIKYSKKHNLSDEALTAVILYPIFKSAKKNIPINNKKTELQKKVTQKNISNNETVQTPSIENSDISNEIIEETPNYIEEFEKHKKRYEEIKENSNILSNKYYAILQEMTPIESQYYKIYCSMTADELREQKLYGEYDEAMAKIVSMKLFDAKNEIEIMLKTITNTNYSNKDDIEFLGEYINEYKKLVDKLQELDKKISDDKNEAKVHEDSKVFFLTDRTMQPIIPDIIKEKGYQASLLNIIQKAQEGHIQKKKGSNIMPLKTSKIFKDEIGKTVFSVRNYKIVVSYVKLNSGTGLNDGGIMILTASLLNPNTIQEDTTKILRENMEQIKRQIDAIEIGNPEQIALQSMIREELTKPQLSNDETLEEGELNGRKTR